MNALDKFSGYGHWLVRLSLAGTFLYHGVIKFPMAQGLADMMGMPVIMVYLLAMMEVVGGIFILWGAVGPDWATRVAGVLFAIVMFGAITMFHWENGWSFTSGWGEGTNGMGGMEFQTLILAISLFFMVKGNGANQGND